MHGFVQLFKQAAEPANLPFSYEAVTFIFVHSLFLGLVLTYTTYLTLAPKLQPGDEAKKKLTREQAILGASNILFLCLGLSGVMILVGNNFTRALAIGATISLIRFRIKIGNKNLGSNLLFAIIVGVACGLQELAVAWVVTIVYTIVQAALYWILRPKEAVLAKSTTQLC